MRSESRHSTKQLFLWAGADDRSVCRTAGYGPIMAYRILSSRILRDKKKHYTHGGIMVSVQTISLNYRINNDRSVRSCLIERINRRWSLISVRFLRPTKTQWIILHEPTVFERLSIYLTFFFISSLCVSLDFCV